MASKFSQSYPGDRSFLLSQSAPEKPTNLCAPRVFLTKFCPPCLIIIQSCLFWLWNKQTFRILSPAWAAFRSHDLNVLRAQRIIGYLNYPQINQVETSDHMDHKTPILLPVHPWILACLAGLLDRCLPERKTRYLLFKKHEWLNERNSFSLSLSLNRHRYSKTKWTKQQNSDLLTVVSWGSAWSGRSLVVEGRRHC